MTIEYASEARERIKSTEYNVFSELVQRIQKSKLDAIVKQLPKLNGFRTGKDTEPRLKRYFSRVKSWTDKDWTLMLDVWMAYTESHQEFKNALGFKSKRGLEKLLEELLSSKEKREELIGKLIQEAYTRGITQKAFQTWMCFSPLPLDASIEKLLSMVPEESSAELKSRVAALESAIKLVKNEAVTKEHQLQLLNKNINKLNTDLTVYSNRLESIVGNLKQASDNIASLNAEKNQMLQSLSTYDKAQKSLQTAAIQISNQVKSVQKDVKLALSKVDNSKRLAEGVMLLEQRHIQLEGDINLVLHELEALKSQGMPQYVDSYEQELLAEKLQALDVLTKEVNAIKHSSFSVSNYREEAKQLKEELRSLTRIYTKGEEIAYLQSNEEIITHLEGNLNTLGMKKSHAKQMSKEITAALMSGQIVSLRGSLASIVAERCAACLTGGEFKVVKVPFGSASLTALNNTLDRLVQVHEESNYPIAIIIEGINRTAFEAYGDSLKQLVIERMFNLHSELNSMLIFTTIIDGPSTIPAGLGLLELGPVFSLDSLKWIDKPARKAKIGTASKEMFCQTISLNSDEYEWEDSIVPNWLYKLSSPLWRKAVVTADACGRDLDPSIEEPFIFTAFGWTVPMAAHLNSERLTDLVELTERDDRLEVLLAKQELGVVNSDEVEIY